MPIHLGTYLTFSGIPKVLNTNIISISGAIWVKSVFKLYFDDKIIINKTFDLYFQCQEFIFINKSSWIIIIIFFLKQKVNQLGCILVSSVDRLGSFHFGWFLVGRVHPQLIKHVILSSKYFFKTDLSHISWKRIQHQKMLGRFRNI